MPRARLLAVICAAALLVVLPLGTITYRYFAEQARLTAFATAITKAEEAGLVNPDLQSLSESRRFEKLNSEKARVRKLETEIAAATLVVEFVKAYNNKDINKMLSQLDHQTKVAAAGVMLNIIRVFIPADFVLRLLPTSVAGVIKWLNEHPNASRNQIIEWLGKYPSFDETIKWLKNNAAEIVLGVSQLQIVNAKDVKLTENSATLTATIDHRFTVPGMQKSSRHTLNLTLNRGPSGWLIYWAEFPAR